MCTVTFIPVNKTIYITSNRDEKNWRSPALPPAIYVFKTGKILFPKDSFAGGTWIAVHESGRAIVFLNGAWISHAPGKNYARSRGLVLLELIDNHDPVLLFSQISFEQIEPFTAIIYNQGSLFECRWDGIKKYYKPIAADAPQIWSSTTLYSPVMVMRRDEWFKSWQKKHSLPSQEDIMNFHQYSGDGDPNHDLLMNRNDMVYTVSITSLAIEQDKAVMIHQDLKNNRKAREELHLGKAIPFRP
jgi:hypothetical protein